MIILIEWMYYFKIIIWVDRAHQFHNITSLIHIFLQTSQQYSPPLILQTLRNQFLKISP